MGAHNGHFDATQFLRELDQMFAAHRAPDDIDKFLSGALATARAARDLGGQLTVLNEMAGFYRSISHHDDAAASAQSALDLIGPMGLTGTDTHATTLINAATALRAGGRYDESRERYREALTVAEASMSPGDRRLAALHNNLSMLASETGDLPGAQAELLAALRIVEAASTDPDGDVDVAATLTNLALVEFALGEDDAADDHIDRAMAIFAAGGNSENPHAAAALAGYAEACLRAGRPREAVGAYERALVIIARSYGTDSDAYRITAENLTQARSAMGEDEPALAPSDRSEAADSHTEDPSSAPASGRHSPAQGTSTPGIASPTDGHHTTGGTEHSSTSTAPRITGLELARRYWAEVGEPMVRRSFPTAADRVAAGLVGHGSECYGFDDEFSRDHDFGPGFCLWLTSDDAERIGAPLQAAYDALPTEFLGFGPRVATPRTAGDGRRVGVFEIGAFYESITGYRDVPDQSHQWLLLEEPTLAAATNGAVFTDPVGEFSRIRAGLRRMPDDVWLALISRRLGMVSQAGQYNAPRMLQRGDADAAWLSIGEFVGAAASLVFLLNKPVARGYLPYYKWRFAALRRLATQPASRLPGAVGQLSVVLRLASAACFGGAQFGEGGKGAVRAREQVAEQIDEFCADVVRELRQLGLTTSGDTFLEHQRPFVEAGIADSWLRSV